jgi:hypothetical protein
MKFSSLNSSGSNYQRHVFSALLRGIYVLSESRGGSGFGDHFLVPWICMSDPALDLAASALKFFIDVETL